MAGNLILARHHQSEWNKLGRWTGLYDAHLDDYGREKSRDMGALIEGLRIDHAYVSELARTHETLAHMLEAANLNVPIERHAALNERDYGDYTGKNKWEVEGVIGAEAFKKLRRSWDHPVPGGESLKMVYERVVPFYRESVMPRIQEDKNIIIVAHGNSLRALIKHLEDVSDDDIAEVEMPFGAVLMYELDAEGRMKGKEHRQVPSDVDA